MAEPHHVENNDNIETHKPNFNKDIFIKNFWTLSYA
jgi:hypothetical protein